MPILKAENLIKKFNDFTAVDDISFGLEEGEILGLLGSNGAGKTTTIQMLLGILTPTAGKISYFGKSLKDYRSEIMEQVNFSSTYTNLPNNLKVIENLNVIAHLYDIPDRKKRLAKIIELFKLEELINQKNGELSAGQVTRVNLAKAFINFPRVLLLDEPTASLDPDIAEYVRDFLLAERRNFNLSIIITSHNMAEVEKVCDRVIFIDEGRIISDDTPQNLAKSINISHLELMVNGSTDLALGFCRKQGYGCQIEGKCLVVDMPEKAIADFLQDMSRSGISYDEISIKKPSLEDYFLEVAKATNKSADTQ